MGKLGVDLFFVLSGFLITYLLLHEKGRFGFINTRNFYIRRILLFGSLGWTIPEVLANRAEQSRHAEDVVTYVGWDGVAEGAIVTRDRPRPAWDRVIESRCAVTAAYSCSMAQSIREATVIMSTRCTDGVPPEAKAAVIRRLKTQGRVAMIGDGSNDAPSLAEADIGIAFGAPTALAAGAAGIVIPGKRLERVLEAFLLIGVTRQRIGQNLSWALTYNVIAIPLAASGMLSPLVAAADTPCLKRTGGIKSFFLEPYTGNP